MKNIKLFLNLIKTYISINILTNTFDIVLSQPYVDKKYIFYIDLLYLSLCQLKPTGIDFKMKFILLSLFSKLRKVTIILHNLLKFNYKFSRALNLKYKES